VSERLEKVLAAIDGTNARDPVKVGEIARAVLYGQRMSRCLEDFMPAASEHLRIAARAQHIERWIIPRESYPEGRIAYLSWRKALQQHHARRTAEIMREHGYPEADVERVGSLLRKERLKYDADVQTLEDVICLVFLQYEAPEFIAKHDDEKVVDILAKTARKMSQHGLKAAGKLDLDPRLARLLARALESLPTG
jgi:hypothetical protein